MVAHRSPKPLVWVRILVLLPNKRAIPERNFMYSSFFKSFILLFFTLILYTIFISIAPISYYQDLNSSSFNWPLPNNKNITCYFGPRISPTSGASSYHYGIDIGAQEGTPIYSCFAGKVIYTGFNRCKWIYNYY